MSAISYYYYYMSSLVLGAEESAMDKRSCSPGAYILIWSQISLIKGMSNITALGKVLFSEKK